MKVRPTVMSDDVKEDLSDIEAEISLVRLETMGILFKMSSLVCDISELLTEDDMTQEICGSIEEKAYDLAFKAQDVSNFLDTIDELDIESEEVEQLPQEAKK